MCYYLHVLAASIKMYNMPFLLAMLFLGISAITVTATVDKDTYVRMFIEALFILTEKREGRSEHAPVRGIIK